MEMSQRNSLCSCLKQTKCVTFFFFYKIGEQEGRIGPPGGLFPVEEGEEVGKGCGR
jgi:hypothetical protein